MEAAFLPDVPVHYYFLRPEQPLGLQEASSEVEEKKEEEVSD